MYGQGRPGAQRSRRSILKTGNSYRQRYSPGQEDSFRDSRSSDRGSTARRSTDRGSTARRSSDRRSSDRGSTDRGSTDRGSTDRGSSDRGSTARRSSDRGSTDRGSSDRGSTAGTGSASIIPPAILTQQHSASGIFGFGLSHNKPLDLIIVIVVALIGIVIKLSLAEDNTRSGNAGPASSTLWGYGLTAIAVSILVFIGIYHSKKLTFDDKGINIVTIIVNTLPIIVTLILVIYTMYLNFSFFSRINSDRVSNDFRMYSTLSSSFLLLQILSIAGYLFTYTTNKDKDKDTKPVFAPYLFTGAAYIFFVINFVFLIMMHINLAFFSTDETTSPTT